jgi:hypothetical protein
MDLQEGPQADARAGHGEENVMPLTIDEARRLGSAKLGIAQPVFDKALERGRALSERPQDTGPLTLALALLGTSGVKDLTDIQGEMMDAFEIISKAESEWRMEMAVGSLGVKH